MSVYVDTLAFHGVWRYGKSCHMVADTAEELHAMADRIGHKREWFQASPPASVEHYDLTASRRAKAVKLGAVEVDRRAFVELIRKWRADRRPGVMSPAQPDTREGGGREAGKGTKALCKYCANQGAEPLCRKCLRKPVEVAT